MPDVLANLPLMAAITASVLAQVVKVIIEYFSEKKVKLSRLLDTGGMPSAHSAGVTALSTSIALQEGWRSPYFAISAVFAYLVMYDATGIRRAAGMQAQLINELIEELSHMFDEGFQPKVLKTLLGHTYPQVAAGFILGIVTGIVAYSLSK